MKSKKQHKAENLHVPFELSFTDKFTEKEANAFLQSNLDEALLQEQIVINLSKLVKMDVAGLQTILLLKQLCEIKGIDCLYLPMEDESLKTLLIQNGLSQFTQNLN